LEKERVNPKGSAEPEVKIRAAKPEDVQEVVKLAEKLSQDESLKDSMIIPSSQFQDPKWILKNINRANAAVYVAELEGKIVGYALGWINQPWAYRGKRGYFCDCFVEGTHRGKGIGKKLAEAMIEWFKKNGVECIETDVYVDNQVSLKMFKSLNFKEIAKRLRLTLKPKETVH